MGRFLSFLTTRATLKSKSVGVGALDPAVVSSASQNSDPQEAVLLCNAAIARNPDSAEAYYKRGNVLKLLGDLRSAIDSFNQAIERKPSFAFAYCNRGAAEQALGMNAEALKSYDLAITFDSTDAMSHYNRALLLQEESRWDEVIAGYDRAISINPYFADAQYNRSLALLYCGYLNEGWRNYEWRWKNATRLGMGELRDFSQPLWLGEQSISGRRLLLHSEGGLGDTLQFCRYARLAAANGAEVYLELQPPLRDMLSDIEGVSEVIEKGSPLPNFDYHCPLMSLPLAFGTTLATIPGPAKYLRVDRTKIARWESLTVESGGPRIGLVWSGNPHNANDQRRSVRLIDWIPHLPSGYRYYQLQKDVRDEDRATLKSCPFINFVDEDVQDFLHTAAMCQCMDLVISVDTSLAHLSGTLGRPTWLMLPFVPDWRWLRGRSDSPWYPAAKLFRQESPGNWSDVFHRIAANLRREFPIR